jgi:hypothetical protein
MSDIKYRWTSKTAVGLSADLELPQFKVMGHKQIEKVISLSTGKYKERSGQKRQTVIHWRERKSVLRVW